MHSNCSHNEEPCPDSFKPSWCCEKHDICGKSYPECKPAPIGLLGKMIRIFLISLIIIFFLTCIYTCIRNQFDSNEIFTNNTYQPVTTITSVIHSTIEESPPSYEEVMNSHNSNGLE
ncbi:unnamed protein product [Adineta steineri]|uniref:Uncharacterized protein n=2 Tax=Adineta steineri TaxID=433720 RepID=A0A815CR10_9BILA|nr:unnamed protein product [Adineta steineri]CAF1373771.1 unnamed protein product [Adineta steineri]CAF3538198.1 unnamed protein product [Adineta steineri]CAF3934465.1 unnamed protein product [Adineta steineri]